MAGSRRTVSAPATKPQVDPIEPPIFAETPNRSPEPGRQRQSQNRAARVGRVETRETKPPRQNALLGLQYMGTIDPSSI